MLKTKILTVTKMDYSTAILTAMLPHHPTVKL
jgi:hypothetical protein